MRWGWSRLSLEDVPQFFGLVLDVLLTLAIVRLLSRENDWHILTWVAMILSAVAQVLIGWLGPAAFLLIGPLYVVALMYFGHLPLGQAVIASAVLLAFFGLRMGLWPASYGLPITTAPLLPDART
jgi:hypothetical protein